MSNRDVINDLDPKDKYVHIAFRPRNDDIRAILVKCPKLKLIQIPKSYLANVAESTRNVLTLHNIQLIEGDVWGHRCDINKYFTVPKSVFELVDELKETISKKEIATEISKTERISKDLAEYIVI